MRIVGGSLRGRRLAPVPDKGVRPTSDRLRESLFNILQHHGWLPVNDPVSGDAETTQGGPSVVLDAFCGTGALALEALSRGVDRALLMDRHAPTLATARDNAATLGVEDRCRFVKCDATRPPYSSDAAGLCFLDPPYRQGLLLPALSALDARGWIAPGAICILEADALDPIDLPPQFEVLDDRRLGKTRVVIAGRNPGHFVPGSDQSQ
ncbi:RsmD family RNA methyltransferase [Fodinicurvata sp. EGI_FJ10296]|uniref:RsmD family RNA methyltransferase n=1 Tax=Fodinicurvata sp. EGI_FJ10296 TaxID=3231908 RepID=UPI003452F390